MAVSSSGNEIPALCDAGCLVGSRLALLGLFVFLGALVLASIRAGVSFLGFAAVLASLCAFMGFRIASFAFAAVGAG